ncbi:hypothetical protein M109_3179 [Bacteroides fragilis str. 3397 N2]|nr:hypothetical protein M109_3179 [Bacteroides fragilis str. 3397 N2]EXZ52878.1 hypothetical protein M108_3261 [Bacteroides fragilis str. 3397 T14]EYA42544.1 hypothetical protein M110_3304 [Bacteroides fragilis str. 3397 N3]
MDWNRFNHPPRTEKEEIVIRIEFEERIRDSEIIATICNIIELSNHYK